MSRTFPFDQSQALSNKKLLIKGLVIVFFGLPLCYTTKAFFEFRNALSHYDALLQKEENMSQPLTQKMLQEQQAKKEKDLEFLKDFSSWCQKYQIHLPPERIGMTPEQFQAQLQQDVLVIEEKAKNRGASLPSSFFLGFPEYKKTLPSKEEIAQLNRQEFVCFWIMEQLLEESPLKLLQFSFEKKELPSETAKVEHLGSLSILITANESSFQKLFNKILSSPYFFIIEKIIVENSNQTGPSHSLESKDESIKIILGREEITVLMKLSIFDFCL